MILIINSGIAKSDLFVLALPVLSVGPVVVLRHGQRPDVFDPFFRHLPGLPESPRREIPPFIFSNLDILFDPGFFQIIPLAAKACQAGFEVLQHRSMQGFMKPPQ